MDRQKLEVPETGTVELPSGYTLYWRPDGVGGREYYSDEVGCGVRVWDTAITYSSTLLAAIVQEEKLRLMEAENVRRGF